jgi:hypothetical protein
MLVPSSVPLSAIPNPFGVSSHPSRHPRPNLSRLKRRRPRACEVCKTSAGASGSPKRCEFLVVRQHRETQGQACRTR